MRTLYVRIVATFILIAAFSGMLALLVSNFYHLNQLRSYNERKIRAIGTEIAALYEASPGMDLDDYLTSVGNMGFQIYAVDERMAGKFYGGAYKHREIDPEVVRRVLNGEIYHGMLEQSYLLKAVGIFENSLRNSVGLPLRAQGHAYALFIRPNLEQQIGDVRVLLAYLLGVTFLSSLVLIVIFTRYIVKPVKRLSAATNDIVHGHYDIRLEVSRKDEIGDLARHFAAMAQSLKRLDEMRQEFVANVSHEMQSPLTSIQGFAQTILAGKASPEEVERYLRIIEEESRRMSSLSKQLLTLASLDKDGGALKRTTYRLDEQIRQVLIATEPQWTEKRLSVEPELTEAVIVADAGLLRQVWTNLIGNSVKFTPPDGRIRIGIRFADLIEVEIEDTGPGIPASELPYIFDRFYKADKARNRAKSGSGLGLSIARKIVELHGGAIEARSAEGEGTAIRVSLPRL